MERQLKTAVLVSLYDWKVYWESFLNHLSRIGNINRIKVLLLHNDPRDKKIVIINDFAASIPFYHVIIPHGKTPIYRKKFSDEYINIDIPPLFILKRLHLLFISFFRLPRFILA